MSFHHSLETFLSIDSFQHREIFKSCLQPWDVLFHITEYLHSMKLGCIEGDVSPDAYLIDPHLISIGKGSRVEAGAYIQGPCVIGENCQVRHAAYIRGNLLAGNNCIIGHCTEVKNSIFFDGAQAAHFAYVGDSVLGAKVNLGAGTRLANFKLDGTEVSVKDGNFKHPTGLRKFGAIVGDGCSLGCNSVTSPGSLLAKGVYCYPCSSLRGVVMSNENL